MNSVTPDVTEILDRVRTWTIEERLFLAESILRSLRDERERPKKSLRDLVGLIKTEGPPPDDEECARIIEEARMKKYGR